MRGHIGKKEYKNGTKYYIVVDVRDPETGKRKRKWLSDENGNGFERKRDAERAMPAILKRLQDGTFIEPTDDTFGGLMTKWLEDKRSAVKYNTWKSYKWLIDTHLIPNLGSVKAEQLKAQQIHHLYHKVLLQKISAASIKKLHVLIVDALNRAVTWGIVTRNVATSVELPQGKRAKFDVWDEEQLETFLEAAKADQYFIVFHLAANTGMRQSEILGLRWSDVDLNNKTISVQQALTLAERGHDIDDTKNNSSERAVALFPETVEMLRQHRAKQARQMMKARKLYDDHGLVVQTGKGTSVNPRNMMRNFYNLLKLLDTQHKKKLDRGEQTVHVPRIRFHDLRHTHATILLKKGVHPKIVQERLGHSSIQVTLDTYSHVLPNLQESILASLGESITSRKNANKNSL